MKKPLPALDAALLLPPVSAERYRYFENCADHPFDTGSLLPSLGHAWWLAECALAAYTDPAQAEAIFVSAGLQIMGSLPVRGPIHGGQAYVLADREKVIVAFRGTQAVKLEHLTGMASIPDTLRKVARDMLTDAKVLLAPWNGRSSGRVHCGFAGSLEELLPRISEHLSRAQRENPHRGVWLTGHSLGGALATLAADRLDNVKGVHTFGSPQVGDAGFASRFAVPGWRFRNQADLVPWLPGEALGYVHAGTGRYFDRNRNLVEEPERTALLLDGLMGLPAAVQSGLEALKLGQTAGIAPKALNDHAPLAYAVQVWNAWMTAKNL